MSPLRAAAPVLVALVSIAALGVVYGRYTDRWGPSGQLQAALDRMPAVPRAFGSGADAWTSPEPKTPDEKKAEELEEAVLARGGIKGYVQRWYQNPKGETVQVLIVCGRGGPISVHTPDVCYANQGFQPVSLDERTPVAAADKKGEADKGKGEDGFARGRFSPPATAVDPNHLEIFWAWSADGVTWDVPANPRREYARLPALYKVYVVRKVAPGKNNEASASEKADNCRRFLEQALPGLRRALGAAAPAGGAPTP